VVIVSSRVGFAGSFVEVHKHLPQSQRYCERKT
jgi:hypothetical protein